MDRTEGERRNCVIAMPRENRAETRGLKKKRESRGIISVIWGYFIRKMNTDDVKY